MTEPWAAWIVNHATAIGQLLEEKHPAVEMNGHTGIADADAEDVAAVITLVVAQILQSWLNAGSERDNTIEELEPHILKHVRSWTPSATEAS